MANLDIFIVNVAFPAIGRDIGGSVFALSWILNAYSIVLAALLVPAGRLADRYGRRGGFLLGVAVFTAASAGCAASGTVGFLIFCRVIQAVGAALLQPTSLAMLLAATPPQARSRAVRGWTAASGVAAALGPVVGGLLVNLGWQSVFLANIPIGVGLVFIGLAVLPASSDGERGPVPDLAGAVLVAGAVGLVALGLTNAPGWGLASGATTGCLAGSAILAAALVRRSSRHPAPLVEPTLLASGFGVAVVAMMLFSVAFAAMLLSIIMWLGDVWSWSAITVGLAIAPGPLLIPVLTLTVAETLTRRIGPGRATAAGSLLLAAGTAWWAFAIGESPHYLAGVLPGMLLAGAGVGIALPALVAGAVSALPPARFATGGAVLNMARQIGSVLGVAILLAVVGMPADRAQALQGFHRGWLFVTASAVAAAGAALVVRPARRTATRPVHAEPRRAGGRHRPDITDIRPGGRHRPGIRPGGRHRQPSPIRPVLAHRPP